VSVQPRLPEAIRREPSRRLGWVYRPRTGVLPPDVDRQLERAAALSGVVDRRIQTGTGVLLGGLPWMTLVFGFVPWRVVEEVRLQVSVDALGPRLDADAVPSKTHEAHATGAAAVIAAAGGVWIVGGPITGLVPTATTLVGGGLWVDVTRRGALMVLDRRLARLVEDTGRALWPGIKAFEVFQNA
jgi:hypothetical protein